MGKRKGEAMIAAEMAAVSRRVVDDPMLTSAEHAHRARIGRAVTVEVDVRLASLIGGLARMKRTPAQEAAAARYRGLWERAQIGGARATDYSAVRVDTSGPSEAAVWETGEDARRGYGAAVRVLGPFSAAVVEKVICHEMGVRQAAVALGWGQGGQARGRLLLVLREALAKLAVHFHAAGVVRGSRRVRMEGERPTRWDGQTGEDEAA